MDKKLINSILTGLPIVLFVVDKNYRMKYVNTRFTEVFSCRKEESGEVGRMIHCATLAEGGTCTQEELCNFCTLKHAFSECIEKGYDVYHKIIEKNVMINGRTKVVSLKLTMSEIENNDYVCVVDDVSEIIEMSEREKSVNKLLLSEMSKAKNIQRDLLPQKIDMKNIDFCYIYRQLIEIGGDFFDIYKIDEDHVGIYIADVSGHGVSGGMLTVFLSENFNKKLVSPAEALDDIYMKFNRYRFSENSYITMLSIVIDVKNGILAYSNAGHSTPVLLFTRGRIFELSHKGSPIANWFNAGGYADSSFKFNRGDRLILATDGVSDLRNVKGEEFGLEPLKEKLSQPKTLEQICDEIDAALVDFSDNPIDDMTVLIMEL